MKVPFSLIPEKKLRIVSRIFLGLVGAIKPFFPYLDIELRQSQSELNSREYLAMCITSISLFFIFSLAISTTLTYFFDVKNFVFVSILISLALSFFVFFQQVSYPKLLAARRIKEIDKNLLPALRTLLIHLNSGVPLFQTIVALTHQDFGEVSSEFKTIVKKVNAGVPAVDALEESASKNPSEYYRRALWQLSNGMKAGSNISTVLEEITNNLSSEQIIQIENYGSQLSPLSMFYMIMTVIMPALATTMLIILASFIALDVGIIKIAFYLLYVVILLFQIVFLGMIKTKRPNLISI